jgi:hypothetical protein
MVLVIIMITLNSVAAQWRKPFDAQDITAQSITCDGCLQDNGHKCAHCFECQIGACAIERELENCAHSTDYSCDKVEGFFASSPEAHALLDGLHAGLAA